MEKIKILRKQHGLTMKELGSIVGVAESSISLYENGKRQPDYDTLQKIADYFHVSVDYLLGREDSKPSSTPGNVLRVPVFGQVVAGIPIEAIEDIDDYEELEAATHSDGEYFALKIKGNSMQPRMNKGDVVIVRKQEDVDTGDVAIVLVNGNDATCKKIKKTPEGILLLSTNPDYEPMFFSKQEIISTPVKILGKVVELRAKY